MRAWKDLGFVETIYEEDHEDVSNSPSLTPSTTSPSPPHSSSYPSSSSLRSKVEEWSRATGRKTDVVVHVYDQSFHLHKERLASGSGYLRRRFTESPAVTVSPPLPIDAGTFAAVAEFCYGGDIPVTPFNVAPIRVAAGLLEMTEEEDGGGWSLVEKTEEYLGRAVHASPEYAAIVLRTCLELLPEAERTASLASRCVEALAEADGGGGWLDDVASLGAGDFQMVADSVRERSTRTHDLLYRIVDHYLQKHSGKLTEGEKGRMCCCVDSKRLSPRQLVHLIQNPRMPLRIIVQAMLVEQLLTRRAIFDRNKATTTGGVTLGTILQRDATLRQSAHLRASLEATTLRIRTLERDLADMKRRLTQGSATPDPEQPRSASCRFLLRPEEEEEEPAGVVEGSWVVPSVRSSCDGRSLGQMLLHRFRNAFRRARPGPDSHVTTTSPASAGVDADEPDASEPENIGCRRQPTHRRHHSFA